MNTAATTTHTLVTANDGTVFVNEAARFGVDGPLTSHRPAADVEQALADWGFERTGETDFAGQPLLRPVPVAPFTHVPAAFNR